MAVLRASPGEIPSGSPPWLAAAISLVVAGREIRPVREIPFCREPPKTPEQSPEQTRAEARAAFAALVRCSLARRGLVPRRRFIWRGIDISLPFLFLHVHMVREGTDAVLW